jgi:hypothetical protein
VCCRLRLGCFIGHGHVYNIRGEGEEPIFVLGLGFHGYASMVALLDEHRVGDDVYFDFSESNPKPMFLVGAAGGTTGIPTVVAPPGTLPYELRARGKGIVLKAVGPPSELTRFALNAGIPMTLSNIEKLQKSLGVRVPKGRPKSPAR